MFSTKGQEDESRAGNAERWREAMQGAYAVAIENGKKCARRGMRNYTTVEPQDHVPTLVRRHSHIWRIHNSRKCRRVTAWRNGEEGSDPDTRRKRPARVRQPRRIYASDQLSQPTFKLLQNSTVSVKRPCGISHVQTTRSSFMYSFL